MAKGTVTRHCNRALPFTTVDEIRSVSHVRSLMSPLADAMRLPRLRMKTSVDSLTTPDISTAIGWRSNLSVREAHILRFKDSASLAAALA